MRLKLVEFSQRSLLRLVADTAGPGRVVVAEETPGLELRLGKRKATWTSRVSVNGTAQKVRLGYFPAFSVAAAVEAHETAAKRAKMGLDPYSDTQRRADLLVADLVDRWEAQSPQKSAEHRATLVRRNFKPLLSIPAALLATSDVQAIYTVLRASKEATARNALVAFRTILRAAIHEHLIEVDPTAPLALPPRPFGTARYTLNDVVSIFAAADDLHDWQRRFLFTLALIGTRTGETSALNIGDVSLNENRLEIPAALTKTKKTHWIPISPWLRSILQDAIGDRIQSNAPLFLNGNGNRIHKIDRTDLIRWVNAHRDPPVKKGDRRYCKLHDWRKTLLTDGARLGLDHGLLDQCLNHSASATFDAVTQAYQTSHRWPERQRTMLAWSEVLKHLTQNKPAQNLPKSQNEEELRNIIKRLA